MSVVQRAELSIPTVPMQINRPRFALAVLGDYTLAEVGLFKFWIVVEFTVQKHYNISILLD